ncbi:MAG: putative quinol monooxygenase [Pseudomonadota bacterium]
MSGTLFDFARIVPKPEYFEDASDAILAIVPDTREEAGCLQFTVLAEPDEGALYLFEEWQDEAALKTHHDKPYTRAVMDNYTDWLAEPLRFETMYKLA